jgi:hypothetical protein
MQPYQQNIRIYQPSNVPPTKEGLDAQIADIVLTHLQHGDRYLTIAKNLLASDKKQTLEQLIKQSGFTGIRLVEPETERETARSPYDISYDDKPDRSPLVTARVSYVSPDFLPSGPGWHALSMYDPMEHAIYIANNLPSAVENFVYWHEVGHSLGIIDEHQADLFAFQRTGYQPGVRRRAA